MDGWACMCVVFDILLDHLYKLGIAQKSMATWWLIFESYFILASKLDWEELIYIVFPACLLIPVSYILLIFWANWTCYSDGAHWWLLGCCSNTEAVWSVGELAVLAQWLEHWQLNMNCNPATSVQYKNYSQWLPCFLSACVICYILELYSCTIRCWY